MQFTRAFIPAKPLSFECALGVEMNISKIDKNFVVDAKIDKKGFTFFDPEEKPFKIYGVKRYGDRFYRMPLEIAETVSEGVHSLSSHTSGGRQPRLFGKC